MGPASTDGGHGFDPAKHCGGKTRRGTRCEKTKGWGTGHVGVGCCKLHGGSTPTHERAASRELARQACETLGVPIEVDPAEALIRELWETAGNVEFYRQLVQQLPAHPEADEFVPPAKDSDTAGYWIRGEPGVYGRTYHVSGIPTGEAKPNILVVLYNEERKHLVDVAAAALKAGVEERRVRMAETDATQIFGAMAKALAAMGLGDRLDEFRTGFAAALRPDVEPLGLGASRPG
jgi:hypothetical protein